MRTTKLGAVVASLAIAAGTTVLLAVGPAQAATTTQATLDISGHTKVKGAYGDYVGLLEGAVTFTQSDGTTAEVYDGNAQLERRLPGGSWTVVRNDDSAGFLYFGTYGSHARGNVQYRVHYLGGSYTDPDGNPATWDPAYSNVVTVGTFWNLHDSGSCSGGCHLKGRLAPTAKRHKVLVQVKHGSWQRYKVVYTDSRSRFRVGVTPTRGNGTLYRLVVAGTKNLLKTYSTTYRAYRY